MSTSKTPKKEAAGIVKKFFIIHFAFLRWILYGAFIIVLSAEFELGEWFVIIVLVLIIIASFFSLNKKYELGNFALFGLWAYGSIVLMIMFDPTVLGSVGSDLSSDRFAAGYAVFLAGFIYLLYSRHSIRKQELADKENAKVKANDKKEAKILKDIQDEIKALETKNSALAKALLKHEATKTKLLESKNKKEDTVNTLQSDIEEEKQKFDRLKAKYPFLSQAKIVDNR
ncbi:hypothetical protein N9D45_01605 [Gammaproteobacteria bacterium]|nr:hypothetical protein [Gammaproteobacteria bacterium]